MMNIKLIRNFASEKDIYFNFVFLKDNIEIGQFSFAVDSVSITLSKFEIFSKYRGLGYSKEALKLIEENSILIAKDYGISEFKLEVVPYNEPTISIAKTIELYEKYLKVNLLYRDKRILSRTF